MYVSVIALINIISKSSAKVLFGEAIYDDYVEYLGYSVIKKIKRLFYVVTISRPKYTSLEFSATHKRTIIVTNPVIVPYKYV